MFPLCVRRRSGRYAIPDPQDMKTRHVWLLLGRAAGWSFVEIAQDWRLSVTRVQQIFKQGCRREKVLFLQLSEMGAL